MDRINLDNAAVIRRKMRASVALNGLLSVVSFLLVSGLKPLDLVVVARDFLRQRLSALSGEAIFRLVGTLRAEVDHLQALHWAIPIGLAAGLAAGFLWRVSTASGGRAPLSVALALKELCGVVLGSTVTRTQLTAVQGVAQ